MTKLRSTLFATVTLATVAFAAPSFAMMMMPMGGGSSMPSGSSSGGMMMDQMPMPSGGQMGSTQQQSMQQPGMQTPQAGDQQQTQTQSGVPQQQGMPQQGMMMTPQQMQQAMPGMNMPMQPGQQMPQMGQQMMNAMPGMPGAQTAQYPAPQVQVPPTPAAQATAWTYSRLVNILNQPLTGAPDKDFLQGMIAQHEAAIDLARIELLHGTNPEARKIAEQVVASHEAELQNLKTLAWGQTAAAQTVDPAAVPSADQSAHTTHVIK